MLCSDHAIVMSRHCEARSSRWPGVLESQRAILKSELLSKDEGALFDIANNFDLRHRNANQRSDYDPLFLEWVFSWYLGTITLVASLAARSSESTA